ncbi:MAG TPA: GspMb/PilO family protein [Candidatus Binatia bacterium]|nr:GspMb/PilO family protein [Candidatus Binatia bacterium]
MNSVAEVSAKVCWLGTFAIAGMGYFAVVGPSEARLTELDAQSDALLARVLADEQTVKDVDRLNRIQREISGELDGVNLGTDRAGVIAEFLRDVESLAASRRVRLLSVQNQLAAGGAGARPASSVSAPSDPFESTSVDVVLQGRYGDVLQTIADLSHSRVLMKIQQSSIDRAKGQQDERSPVLSVQLKLTVFYLRVTLSEGHAAAAT